MIRSRKLLSKYTQKPLQAALFSDEHIFKVKQLYNSDSDVAYVHKRMRKLENQRKDYSAKLKPFPRK